MCKYFRVGLCTDCGPLWFQLEKIYDPTNEEDDMVEMEEERLRMREHVMNEVQQAALSNLFSWKYAGEKADPGLAGPKLFCVWNIHRVIFSIINSNVVIFTIAVLYYL